MGFFGPTGGGKKDYFFSRKRKMGGPSAEKKALLFIFLPCIIPFRRMAGQDAPVYVHAIYEEIFSDKRPACFYLCGWADMLHDARQRWKKWVMTGSR